MASSSSSPPPPPWKELPHEILTLIFQKVGAIYLFRTVQSVCKSWYQICKEPITWQVIDLRRDFTVNRSYFDCILMKAVDLSHNQLRDVKFDMLDSEHLFSWTAHRSCQLRSLHIEFCIYTRDYMYWGDIISVGCKSFPLLEELHIFYHIIMDDYWIKSIGHSCPRLRSFKLNKAECDNTQPFTRNEIAFAIASSLPGLRHLELVGDNLSDEGLKSILDGCVKLEFLDLRECRCLKLEGGLRERCSRQLKTWKPPFYSIKESAIVD